MSSQTSINLNDALNWKDLSRKSRAKRDLSPRADVDILAMQQTKLSTHDADRGKPQRTLLDEILENKVPAWATHKQRRFAS